jgi:outer membrane receptor protein involved in Fe transport
MKLNRLFVIVVLFFITAAGNVLLSATLEGTVLDPSGKVVPGVSVNLIRALVVIGECRTNASGVYKFENLQAGNYQISANTRGLSSQSIAVNVSGESTKQDINLKLSAVESQVVVSASMSAALVPEIGSSVSLVSGQEISDRGAQNAFEILRGIPGLEVSQTGRKGGVTGVYIRGGESKYNLIMVDGIAMNEFGGNFDMASLPADGIERVELIRGPQSALYGSNAVTGVINIVTHHGEGPPRFTALAEGGSYSTRRFATGGSGLTGGLSWAYNLSRLDSEGVVQNDKYRNQSALLNLGYKQGNHRQFDFSFVGNANSNGAPGPYGSDPNDFVPNQDPLDPNSPGVTDRVSRGKQNLFGYKLGYVEQLASRLRQVTTVSFATNDLYYHSYYWGFTSDSTSENLRGTFNTRSEIQISNNDTLTAGFEFNKEQIKNTYISDAYAPFTLSRASFAYFAENRWSPTSRLFLVSGVRIDNLRTGVLPTNEYSRPFIPKNSIVQVNPKISASYLAYEGDSADGYNGARIHGSFGTGIRPPDGFELAFTDNPALKPEKNISFDAGVEQRLFSSRFVLDTTYFFNRFDDQIVTSGSINNDNNPELHMNYMSENIKNARAQGLEITFKLQPLSSLELGGGYTFDKTEILALDGSSSTIDFFTVGQQLLRRPRHAGSYNITWRYKRLTLNTNASIRGAVLDVDPSNGLYACSMTDEDGNPLKCIFENKGYTRVDAGFSYRLPRGVELYGRVYNLLNKKYEETFGYPALGANFMAGMKFAFPAE